MNRDDAEEYTQALGQVVSGGWRQVALGVRLAVPQSLGLTTKQWVDRIGEFARPAVAQRFDAIVELANDGMSNRQIATVLGIHHTSVGRTAVGGANAPLSLLEPAEIGASEPVDGANAPPPEVTPLDALAALAAGEKVRAEHDRQAKLAADREARRHDDWYTPRWLFDQLGVTFDLDVCAPIDPARRTVPARRYYTQQDDGLAQPWEGLVWCNPPYSAPQPWMQRFAEHDNGMLLSVVSAKTGRMAPHWRTADRIVMFAGMVFDRPDGSTEAPYLPLTLCARGPAAELLTDIEHKWAGPVLERVS